MTNLTVTEVYAIGAPIVLAMIFAEVLISNWQNRKYYKREDTYCTVGLLAGNIVMAFAIKGLVLAFHFYLYQFRVFDFANTIPFWVMWILTFIMIDLVFYVYHRMSHRIRFLWAIHLSHHSSEEMNFAVSFRQAWFGPISKIPFFMTLPLLGFDPTIIAVAGVISTLWGIVGHTQIVDKLGPLEWVFNTPSHHRVHHGSNKQYIDKNYGNLLIIWDRMFGTFEPEEEPVTFGLVNNVNTFNPAKITFMAWSSMIEDIKNKNDFSEMLNAIFGPPNTHIKNKG
ncbi:MAG: fatty acid hydroxylase [Gammaproteobacteria bacterium]|nr:fatty acid hydroxylase [Gammaproteobacteria bacterium]|tara:strand:+ start:239 stop:1084 length:846 start_codon:yes stop_codon:yes gene_type:complete